MDRSSAKPLEFDVDRLDSHEPKWKAVSKDFVQDEAQTPRKNETETVQQAESKVNVEVQVELWLYGGDMKGYVESRTVQRLKSDGGPSCSPHEGYHFIFCCCRSLPGEIPYLFL